MGILRNPVLFSQHFNFDPAQLKTFGALDPILNGDTRLFIDPTLLAASSNDLVIDRGIDAFEERFSDVIRILKHSQTVNDLAWRNAAKLINLDERPELCLGFGGHTTRGRRQSGNIKIRVVEVAREIISLGIVDPKLFSLISLLEDGVGPDTIGDMTANAILPALLPFTERIANELNIPIVQFRIGGIEARLPCNPYAGDSGIILVPKDILRDLPVATDWDDVSRAASKNEKIRDEVNRYIGDIWRQNSKRQKELVRHHALGSSEAFQALLNAVYLLEEDRYDFAADRDGHEVFRKALGELATSFPLELRRPRGRSIEELQGVVDAIVAHFRELIETNGINQLLWYDGKPRKEKAAQKLFFAVADVYCRANNVDVTPEADSGGGPVDFKFSSGYDARVIVEIKLSSGQVVHGYTKQLAVYEEAESTIQSTLLILDVGGMGRKLEQIQRLRNERVRTGMPAPQIEVVDAELKPSASKR